MGGRSSEHEISLASARSVLEALDPERYEAVTVEIGRDGQWELGTGEDGERRRDAAGTRRPGAGDARRRGRRLPGPARALRRGRHRPGAARARRDPVRRRRRARLGARDGQGRLQGGDARPRHPGHAQHHAARGPDAPRTRSATRSSSSRRGSARRSGSRRSHAEEELAAAVELAFRHDEKVLVEEFVDGIEVECGVLGNDGRSRRSPARSSRTAQGADWYDFSAKYDEGGMDLLVPPRLPAGDDRARAGAGGARRSSRASARAWRASTSSSASDGEVLVNELNTIPGFTATSVYAKLFEASGIPYAGARRPAGRSSRSSATSAVAPRATSRARRPR